MLLTNKVLRKLELEGNCLGAKTAKELGFALQMNSTLKFLDLESNQLSPQDNTDSSGIMRFIDGLRVNNALLSLNVSNNQLGPEIGQQFRICLEKNHCLIDFEFANNSFKLEDVRKIQDYLRRNREKYEKARLAEWRERNTMREECDELEKYYLEEYTEEEQERMEEEAKDLREREIDEQWKKYMAEERIERENMMIQLAEAAAMRGARGKKKGKKGGKGKGKGKKK